MSEDKKEVNKVSPAAGFNHSFDVGIAIACGVEAAIVYNNLVFWIVHNFVNGTNFHNGTTWTYNTPEKMHLFIPYLTPRQIKYGIQKLFESGIIIKNNFNKDRFDKTNWYALADDSILENSRKAYEASYFVDRSTKSTPSIEQICPIDKTNLSDGHNTYTKHTVTSNTHPIVPQNAAADAGEIVEKSSIQSSKQQTKPPKKKPDIPKLEDISQAAKDLLPLFVEAIRSGRPKYVLKNELAMLVSIDEMLKDGRTADQIIKVMKWAVNDKTIRGTWTGWANKIMCKNPAAYLCEKFEGIESSSEAKEIRKFAPSSNDEASLEKWKEAAKGAI